MRHYGLEDYLGTVGRVMGNSTDSFLRQLVELEPAAAALIEGGDLPEHRLDDHDASIKAARLLSALITLNPVGLGRNHDVAVAATKDYLAARGYRLRFASNRAAAVLADQVEADRLSFEDVRRALHRQLTAERPVRPPAGTDLSGRRICLSHSVSRPSPDLAAATPALRTRIRSGLERWGAEVVLPAAAGRPDVDDLFVLCVRRLTSSDALVVLADPRGWGSAIESDYAKRLAMPVFTLRLHDAVRPYDRDGWNVVVDVNPGETADGAERALAMVAKYAPKVHDFAAYRRAMEYKNRDTLARLRGSWEALSRAQRDVAVKVSRVSRPRIEAYLGNGLALELASSRERRSMETALLAPPIQGLGLHQFLPEELTLLARAAEELELDRGQVLAAAVGVATRMSQPFAKHRLRTVADARVALDEVLRAEAVDDP